MIKFTVYKKTKGLDAQIVARQLPRGDAQVAMFNASSTPLEEIPEILGNAALNGRYEDDEWIVRSLGRDPIVVPDGTGLTKGVHVDAGPEVAPMQLYISYYGEESTTPVAKGGMWERSTFPVMGIVADWGADGKLLGFALLGPLAEMFMRNGLDAMFMFAADDEYLDTIDRFYEENGERKTRSMNQEERAEAITKVEFVAEKAIRPWT